MYMSWLCLHLHCGFTAVATGFSRFLVTVLV
jgi:hypothetical protein